MDLIKKQDFDEVLNALLEVILCNCLNSNFKDTNNPNIKYLDSYALTPNASAMRLLARYGKIKLCDNSSDVSNRRVIATFNPKK